MELIQLINITKTFKNKTILDNINLTINSGDFVVLQGKNGSGKSTLIKLITGLLQPNSGIVKVFNSSPKLANAKNELGVVLQNVNLPKKTSVKELIYLFRSYYSNSLTTHEVLKIVNLQDQQNKNASELSGGQKQRLYFALALVGNPQLLILDEPTRNLDVSGCEDFWTQVKKCRERGITILMVTNNQSDWKALDKLVTRTITLADGKIVEDENSRRELEIEPYTFSVETPENKFFKILNSQIKFEIIQWKQDITLVLGLILFSALIAWLFPLDNNYSKLIILVFSGITSLTFAIDKVGSRIAAERIEGWENLLRISPLNSSIYILSKLIVPFLSIAVNLFIIMSLCAIRTSHTSNIVEWINIFLSLNLGIIPFLVCGVALGYLVRPKIFGIINGLSIIVAVITSGLLLPKTLFAKYLLIFSPFYHYSQLAMGVARVTENYHWGLNILWLIWISFSVGLIAIWAYNREQAIQS